MLFCLGLSVLRIYSVIKNIVSFAVYFTSQIFFNWANTLYFHILQT